MGQRANTFVEGERPYKHRYYYGISDFYTRYRYDAVKQLGMTKDEYIKPRKYKDFFLDFFAMCIHKTLDDFWHFTMPYGLGDLFIRAKKIKLGRSKAMPVGISHLIHMKLKARLYMDYRFKYSKEYSDVPNLKFYKLKLPKRRDTVRARKYKVFKDLPNVYLLDKGKEDGFRIGDPYEYTLKTPQEMTPFELDCFGKKDTSK